MVLSIVFTEVIACVKFYCGTHNYSSFAFRTGASTPLSTILQYNTIHLFENASCFGISRYIHFAKFIAKAINITLFSSVM